MTRETKVGLLVGMGVILLIGIIISDHLSVANEQTPAVGPMTGFAERAQDSINSLVEPEPIPGQMTAAPPSRAGSVLQRVQPVPTPREMERPRWEQPPATPADSAGMAPAPGMTPGMAPQQAMPDLPRAYAVQTPAFSAGEASPMTQPRAAVAAAEAIPTLTLAGQEPAPAPPAAAERTQLASALGASPAFDAAAAVATDHTDAALAEASRQASRQVTGTEFIHYVQEGESLYAIAQKYYGNGDYWKSIAQHNPNKVMANGQVRPNVRLVIPNRAGLAQLGPDFIPVRSDAPGRIQLAQGEPPAGMAAPARKAERTIEVKPGDTLTKLASDHLGSAGLWRTLLDANRERLSRPEDLRAGMKLVVPTEAPTAGAAASTQAAGATRESSGKPAAAAADEYTVAEGDNLYRVANKTLGDGKRWGEIYEANKDRLKNPDSVTVGMKLRIPR